MIRLAARQFGGDQGGDRDATAAGDVARATGSGPRVRYRTDVLTRHSSQQLTIPSDQPHAPLRGRELDLRLCVPHTPKR